MLVPAILYKEQISKEFQRKFYTEDMFLETGSLYQWSPEILDNPADGQFDYAIIHNNKLNRVEWRMIRGNPAERSYDKFCKKHNGKKHILKDAIKDKQGNYRDDVIYEIVGLIMTK